MKKKFLQKIADKIINKIEPSKSPEELMMWYNLGMMLDSISVYLGVELD